MLVPVWGRGGEGETAASVKKRAGTAATTTRTTTATMTMTMTMTMAMKEVRRWEAALEELLLAAPLAGGPRVVPAHCRGAGGAAEEDHRPTAAGGADPGGALGAVPGAASGGTPGVVSAGSAAGGDAARAGAVRPHPLFLPERRGGVQASRTENSDERRWSELSAAVAP